MVNAMKALGEKIEEPSLVQKILRSLPDRFCYHSKKPFVVADQRCLVT
jgi:hypothetical protein